MVAQCLRHRRSRAPTLAGMRFVNNDGESAPPMICANLVQNKWKLLHSRDNNFLTFVDKVPQIARSFGMPDSRAHLRELPDGIIDLPVQKNPISYDNHRVKNRLTTLFQPDEPVRQPGDGIGFPAPRRMLNEIALPRSVFSSIRQQLPHHIQLVIARPDLRPRLAPGLCMGRFHQQSIIFDNIGQTLPGQNLLPQIIGLETIGIGRIASTVIPTLIKRQEPGRLAPQMRTEHHLVFIHSKVSQTATNAEKFLSRIPVAFVLLNRICHRLFGETIFQFKRRHRQAIDKQREIKREPLIGIAI